VNADTHHPLRLQLLLGRAEDADSIDPASLTAADHVRWARLRRPVRQREFLLSRFLLRQTGWHDASLAHANGAVVLAHAPRSVRVGVDLEFWRVRDVLRVARFAFAAIEVDQLERLDAEARLDAFYLLWVMKEACAKAAGLPLVDALRECAFIHAQGRWQGQTPIGAGWTIFALQPAAGCYVGLAVHGHVELTHIEARDWMQPTPSTWTCRMQIRI
jgi:hypothetical protein